MTELINTALRKHAQTASDWAHHRAVRELHVWARVFNRRFNLGIGTPAICVERLDRRRLGHYRLGRNAYGLRDEIAIQAEHLLHSPRWRVLGTLLHEMLHAWQFEKKGRDVKAFVKRSARHDKEFRAKAAELGLTIDRRGVTSYPAGETPFRTLLTAHRVEHGPSEEPTGLPRRPPRCKMALWTCGCGVKIRVGRAEIRARCLDCGGRFRKEE